MSPSASSILPHNAADHDPSDYDSAADSDFAASVYDSSSDSAAESTKKTRRKKRREIDSGDEGVVEEESRKKRRKGLKEGEAESGGIGERVRRRKQGEALDVRKQPLATDLGATVNVDDLWAKMNSGLAPTVKPQATDIGERVTNSEQKTERLAAPHLLTSKINDAEHIPGGTKSKPNEEDMITITRTYDFAGQITTEEKLVPRSSAEARLYQQQQATPKPSPSASSTKQALKRPKKRTSAFDPGFNATHLTSSVTSGKTKAPKLNTVEKSKLDWAGYVDKEGIKDELEGAEKAKSGYLGKKDFLNRVDAKREEELASARRKNL